MTTNVFVLFWDNRPLPSPSITHFYITIPAILLPLCHPWASPAGMRPKDPLGKEIIIMDSQVAHLTVFDVE